MKCSKCGKEIANDSNFCEYCGTKVGNNKKKRTTKIVLIVLSVIITMVGFGWGGVILSEYIEEQKTLDCARTLSAQGVDKWVDLDLPSGTLWYGKNADGLFYSFNEAMEQFGNNIPTKEQFDELINNCTCTWTGEGYNIVGSNGNSIFLPAAGYRSNAILGVGNFGIYWSSTHIELKADNGSYISKQAWGLALGHDSLNKLECNTYDCDIYSNFSVRLVHAPFEFVDLGLPSGTLWKDKNETGGNNNFFTYEQALNQFGNKLPTKEQLQELKDKCTWTWNGSGYVVTGPNGNSIVLPATGFRGCDGGVYYVGSDGYYWSSTPNGSELSWLLYFIPSPRRVSVFNDIRCRGLSVRLVQD